VTNQLQVFLAPTLNRPLESEKPAEVQDGQADDRRCNGKLYEPVARGEHIQQRGDCQCEDKNHDVTANDIEDSHTGRDASPRQINSSRSDANSDVRTNTKWRPPMGSNNGKKLNPRHVFDDSTEIYDSAEPDEYDRLLDLIVASVSDTNRDQAQAPRVVCVRHADPAFSDKTWCGKSVSDPETFTFASTDDALYVMSENSHLAVEEDDVCSPCIDMIREILRPGPKRHLGDSERAQKESDSEYPAWVDPEFLKTAIPEERQYLKGLHRILLPSVAELLTASLDAASGTVAKKLRRLPARFPLFITSAGEADGPAVVKGEGDADSPHWQKVGSLNLEWDPLHAVLVEIAKEFYNECLKIGENEKTALLHSRVLAALSLNEMVSGTKWVMTQMVELWLAEAGFHAMRKFRELTLRAEHPKGPIIKLLTEKYVVGVRHRLSIRSEKGKGKGRYLEVSEHWSEIKNGIRAWQGERPNQHAFAITLPSIIKDLEITPDLGGKAKRVRTSRIYDRFRQRLATCKEKGLCPKKPWPEIWDKVRAEHSVP
jgi:hypothetical protein